PDRRVLSKPVHQDRHDPAGHPAHHRGAVRDGGDRRHVPRRRDGAAGVRERRHDQVPDAAHRPGDLRRLGRVRDGRRTGLGLAAVLASARVGLIAGAPPDHSGATSRLARGWARTSVPASAAAASPITARPYSRVAFNRPSCTTRIPANTAGTPIDRYAITYRTDRTPARSCGAASGTTVRSAPWKPAPNPAPEMAAPRKNST